MPPNLLTHQIDAELLNDYEFCVTCIGRDQTVQFGDNRYIALNSTLHNRLNRLTSSRLYDGNENSSYQLQLFNGINGALTEIVYFIAQKFALDKI